jgi:hypothetical protein
MGWETIIPISTINIRSTMMLIEETQEPRYPRTKTHTNKNQGSPPSHDARTMIGEEGEQQITGDHFTGTAPSLCG